MNPSSLTKIEIHMVQLAATLTGGLSVLAASAALSICAAGPAWAQNTPFDKALDSQRAALPTAAPSAAPTAVAMAKPASQTVASGPAVSRMAAVIDEPREPRRARPRSVKRTTSHVVRAANQTYGDQPALTCRTVNWKKGDIIRLQAQPYKQVHVALPENGIDVIMGDKELWALDWIGNRIFLKPTSHSNEGRSTTISAIGQSGNAYEFVVNRVPESSEVAHCVYINVDSGLISRGAWSKPSEREQEITTALGREIMSLREQNENIERQSKEGLKNYRKKLNSNYDWAKGAMSRWNGGEIDSVYDDGRFTYVRMKGDGESLTSIMADIDGKPQLLEYGFDSPSRTYQISGIFPKFNLRSGSQATSISRKAG
jgi:type IV secretory pathway VirB9-like protein